MEVGDGVVGFVIPAGMSRLRQSFTQKREVYLFGVQFEPAFDIFLELGE